MSRMTIDCRAVPSESGCSLTLSGEEDEVLRAATAHAIDVHGHTDGEELRAGLRAALVPEVAGLTVGEGAFVQVIEFRTTRLPSSRTSRTAGGTRSAPTGPRSGRSRVRTATLRTATCRSWASRTTSRRWPTRSTR